MDDEFGGSFDEGGSFDNGGDIGGFNDGGGFPDDSGDMGGYLFGDSGDMNDGELFDDSAVNEIPEDVDGGLFDDAAPLEMTDEIEPVQELDNGEAEQVLEDEGVLDNQVEIPEDVDNSILSESPIEVEQDIDDDNIPAETSDNVSNDVMEIEEDIIEMPETHGETEGQFNFNDVDCYTDTELMDATLDNFQDDKWADMELEEKKQSMNELADYIIDVTGNENPPDIVFRDDMGDGEYGGYDPSTNTLEINENLLDDNAEAADTVAHELWHSYQQQCAEDPTSERGREYQEGFDSYISPEYDYEGYQNQMIETEARAFAQNFKDRLDNLKGGHQ
jgi:hypothetical protein